MQTRLKFTCEQCEARLAAKPSASGRILDCPSCSSPVTVPPCTALVPVTRPSVVIPVKTSRPNGRPVGRLVRKRKRKGGSTPVELRLPGQLGGLKAKVDRKTSNSITTAFAGGVLVAIGAALFAMFGGKGKSA